MDVMEIALGLRNGNHGIPSSPQGRGEAGVGAGAVSNCNGGAAISVTLQAPKGDPEIAEEWTTEQQEILEELLNKYASDSPVIRYAKIGLQIPEKKIEDVTFRCKWVTNKKTGKRRKDDSLSRKSKNKKENATDSSTKTSCHLPVQPNGPSNSLLMLPIFNDDDISHKAIGGLIGQLLEHTAEIFNQISGNFTKFQINDNIGLLCQARENILEVMNEYIKGSPGKGLWFKSSGYLRVEGYCDGRVVWMIVGPLQTTVHLLEAILYLGVARKKMWWLGLQLRLSTGL